MNKLLLINALILLVIISCNVIENEPASMADIKIISPNGGEVFFSEDSSFIIKWSQKNIDKIDILYSIDYLNNWTVIVKSINANLKEYLCKIPSIIADSIRLRIRDTKNINVFDDSDGFFSIKQEDPYKLGKVKILTPTAEAILKGNDKYLITWSNGELVDNIDLHYSLDNGDNWNEIVSYEKNSFGSYEWLVPNKNTQSAKIKLTVRAGLEMRVIDSEGVFEIKKQERDENVLTYFPLNIGDIWIYNRDETADFQSETNSYILKKVLTSETVINNIKYYEFDNKSINKKTSGVSIYTSFFRIDTLNKNAYQYFTNNELLLFNLALFPNEVYDIDSEHYVTLIKEDTIQVFGGMMGRKSFQRGDIYGYSGQWYELLENIGIFVESYSTDYGASGKNVLVGAVIDRVVYGDTTFSTH